jgi:aconitate hydratase
MLGEPISMLIPQVVGFKLTGSLPEGATATDLVLTVTQILREAGVVGKFVEYFGHGLAGLALADRATIGNMSPEYGATCGFFPVDDETLKYLRLTGPSETTCRSSSRTARTTRSGTTRRSSRSTRRSSSSTSATSSRRSRGRAAAGPRAAALGEAVLRRVARDVRRRTTGNSRDEAVAESFPGERPAVDARGRPGAQGRDGPAASLLRCTAARGRIADGHEFELQHGSVVIAAITSCTNTSNPQVMIGAGPAGEEGGRARDEAASRG